MLLRLTIINAKMSKTINVMRIEQQPRARARLGLLHLAC